MRALPIFIVMALLAIPAGAIDTTAVLVTPRQRIETSNFRVSGRLVRVAADGARTSGNFTIKARWFPGVLRVMVQLGQPAQEHREMRENILLEMRPDGQNAIRIARPGAKDPEVIPVGKWSDNPIGPGFDVEDFLEPQYFWPVQSVTENVKFGARDCDLVTSKPGPAGRTSYAQISTWLDHTIGFPVYAEKVQKGSGAVKEFTYLGIRHDQGVWSAHQIQATLRGKDGSTLLIIDHGTAKANLAAADFSAAQMEQF